MKRKESTGTIVVNKKPLRKRLYNYRWLYLMFLPVFIFEIVFHYAPMFGVGYAFTDYKIVNEPTFVGFKNFIRMFKMANFWQAFWNTLQISILKLLLTTLAAVLVSLLLNELRSLRFKKLTQTIIYLPHFLSWVVVASIFAMLLAPTQEGLLNSLLTSLGIVERGSEIYFLGRQDLWRPVFYLINIWKETGWQTIIFLATLSSIDPGLYEAASIDGANRFQRVWNITVPALMNTIVIVIILNLAKVMNLFEPVYVLQNDAVIKQSEVIQTYIFNQTFNSGGIPNYGYTTAVGLFNSLISCFLVLVCNALSKKVRGRGIV